MPAVLNAHIRLGLRHRITADDLDPVNAPALEEMFTLFKARMQAWIDDPEGLRAQWDDLLMELRAEFVKADPRLRLRYATVSEAKENTN